MSLYDEVTLQRDYPECGIQRGTKFRTKSLYSCQCEFTITEDGKLIEHQHRYEPDPERRHPVGGWPLSKRVYLGDKVIDYHGDLLLYRWEPDDRMEELVVRFTHGHLEWIRPLQDYPEDNRTLLVEQGAR